MSGWIEAARLVQQKKVAADRAEKKMLEAAVPIATAVLRGWPVLDDRVKKFDQQHARYEQAANQLRAALAYRDSVKRVTTEMAVV